MIEQPRWLPEGIWNRLPFSLLEMLPHTPSEHLEYYDGRTFRMGDRFDHAGEPCQVVSVQDPGPDGGVRLTYRHLWWEVWNRKSWVDKSPLATTFLLEGANIGQLYWMWTRWTAKGQNLWSWVYVGLALLLWLNWYRVITPDQKFARAATRIGICLNASVIVTVLFFRWIGKG